MALSERDRPRPTLQAVEISRPHFRRRAENLAPRNDDDDDDGNHDGATSTQLPLHRAQTTPEGTPTDKAPRNFTDSDSRIMTRNGVFMQAYNAQAVVSEDQVIVAHGLTNDGTDAGHLVPMLERVRENCGELPEIVSADNGYLSEKSAFRDAHGARGVTAIDFSFAGMTDRAIVRAGLRALEVAAFDDAVIERLLDAYLIRLADEIARTETYRVHPGVSTILEWLPKEERTAIGLGTGNVKKGAYAKLARGSLDAAFGFGGFGCDAEDRTELLRVGASRGAAALGLPLAACRVVVVGDTPKDVAAAHGIGADCIGVGTGGFEPRALLELGAFAAFATLEEAPVREALLDAAHQRRIPGRALPE